jgi:predicted GNAT family acetyltransferase
MGSSSVGSASVEIRHNAAARRFEATIDKLLCRCDYRMHGGTMMLVHTEVPPQLERRGFASMLVRAAFDHARENGLDVLPVCSFVSAWVRRHPEVEPLLAR